MPDQPARLLTIGGSDSGGAAGIQADLKTWTALGVYGMSVITVVTAQNSQAVTAVHPLPPAFVAAQLNAVLSDYGAAAVKTGFIGRTELVETVAAQLAGYRPPHLVVDPVLVNHRGEPMFDAAVTAVYREQLLPLADLLTPNRREAELLTGRPVTTLAEGATAVYTLAQLGPRHVLLKGLADGERLVDLYGDGARLERLIARRLATPNTHGSGDTLSAAAAAFLALGQPMAAAVRRAHQFTQAAIRTAVNWRLGGGHGPVGLPPAGDEPPPEHNP